MAVARPEASAYGSFTMIADRHSPGDDDVASDGTADTLLHLSQYDLIVLRCGLFMFSVPPLWYAAGSCKGRRLNIGSA